MALNGTSWGDLIADAIIAASSAIEMTNDEKQKIRDGWRLVAGKHVEHITENAEVSTDVSLTGVTGVGTPGGPLPVVSPGASGSGTGTIS